LARRGDDRLRRHRRRPSGLGLGPGIGALADRQGPLRRSAGEVAKQLGLPLDSVPLPTIPPTAQPRASLTELFSVNPRLFWQTILIWGGSASAVYGYYLCGADNHRPGAPGRARPGGEIFHLRLRHRRHGKIVVSLIAPKIGRRSLGIVFGFMAGIGLLVLAGYFNAALIGGFPLFILLIAASAFFAEGGFSNLAPYTVEQYGVNLGSRSSGLGQAANGVGKILGPLALALLAGSDNIIAPKATADAVFPAFVFLGGTMLAVMLAFVFLGVETHGRAISLGHEAPAGR
jgi:putative MFS transporter